MDLMQKVTELKQQGEVARTRHARALAGIAVAEDRAAQLTALMKSEFGVSTADEARALLAKLRGEADQEAAEVERLLAEAGGAA
jgi:hypothetical protein